MGILSRRTRAAENTDRARWALVQHLLLPEELLGVQTPAQTIWSYEPVAKAGGYAYLTDRAYLQAIVEAPFGDERRPFTVRVDLTRIEHVSLIDDSGELLIVQQTERGDTSTRLQLYPSPFSTQFVRGLGNMWHQSTGRQADGDLGLWDGEGWRQRPWP